MENQVFILLCWFWLYGIFWHFFEFIVMISFLCINLYALYISTWSMKYFSWKKASDSTFTDISFSDFMVVNKWYNYILYTDLLMSYCNPFLFRYDPWYFTSVWSSLLIYIVFGLVLEMFFSRYIFVRIISFSLWF